ncbi:MAG: sigma-70 family RNA polymerase sigma factor [Myxococcales bacterium]|nr:sigma-70 family RNA polymerase sigma factor [Myxococcales bacterium]
MQRETESELMQRVAAGDTRAYRTLSDHFLDKIVAHGARLLGDPAEAEEVAQETFLRLWQGAARWRPEARLSTWLFKVAQRLCIDRLRRRREVGPDAIDRQEAGDRPSALLMRKQLAERVSQALLALPERQRAAISLAHYEGMTNPEVAEVLEISVEAVESLLARARRSLRSSLSKYYSQE